MPQVALRESSRSSVRSHPAHVDVAREIDRYVETMFVRLRGALLDRAPALAEPAPVHPGLARARAVFLVETLAGFAIGDTVGHVARTARRTLPATREAIDRVLATAGDVAPSRSLGIAPPCLSPGTERPLLERVVSLLHVRLCLGVAPARRLLGAVCDAGDRERFASTLDAADHTPILAFIDQLDLGWRFFTAVTEGTPDPVIEHGPRWRRSRAIWPAWSRRVRGEHALNAIDIDRGHILRIH